jgi:MFS family permease
MVAVFAGGMADRFGNVKVIVVGTIRYALGMLLMSGVDNPWMLNVSTGLLVGAGVAGTSFGIILPAMARAVGEERRPWALGLGTAAGSFGQFVVVPVAQVLIDAFGWMTALNILSASSLAMALLAMPLAPYSGKQEVVGKIQVQTVPEALQEAVWHGSFLLIPYSLLSVYVFSALMGFLWLATVPATSGLVAVMFGTRYMALLYGIVFLGHQIGSFIGVWLGGWLYDRSGSYDVVWGLGVALGIMAAIVHWPIKERPVKRLAAHKL